MKRIALFTVVLLGFLIGAASPAAAAGPGNSASLWARLSGANEVPAGTGDPDASGLALLSLKRNGQLCYVLHVTKVDGMVNAAHIHTGRAGKEGPVAVTLTAPRRGNVATCTWVGRRLAWAIWAHPSWFYVNVHSTTYPDGAARGQLH
jgi:hypothetical protein